MTGIDLKPESVIISDGVLEQLATNASFSPADLHLLLDGRTGQTRIVTHEELNNIEFEAVAEKQADAPAESEAAPPGEEAGPTEAAAASSDVSQVHHNTMVSDLQPLPHFDNAAGAGGHSPSRRSASGHVLSALSSRAPGSASTGLPPGLTSPSMASSAKQATASPGVASAKPASAAGAAVRGSPSAASASAFEKPASAQPGASDWMAVEILPGVTAIVPDPSSPPHSGTKPPSAAASAHDKGVGPEAPPASSKLVPSATKVGTQPVAEKDRTNSASSIPGVSMLARYEYFL